jgi:hypothetical protein
VGPAPEGVDVLRTDGRDVSKLRRRLAAGATLAVTGGDRRGRADLVQRLAGTPVLSGRGAGPCLLPVPGGGALVVVERGRGSARGAR